MIEVPGLTRADLRIMPPAELEALRWSLYARALAPMVAADLDAAEQHLADQDKPPSPATLKARRAVDRERVTQSRIVQAAVRELLLLDDDDDEEPDA